MMAFKTQVIINVLLYADEQDLTSDWRQFSDSIVQYTAHNTTEQFVMKMSAPNCKALPLKGQDSIRYENAADKRISE